MEEFQDVKIIGLDENRFPFVRKEPYIDLFFKLSPEPPKDWCIRFNSLSQNLNPVVRIDKKTNLFIQTYVRDMNHIPEHLEMLKKKINTCNEQHKKKCLQQALDMKRNKQRENANCDAQGKLDAIIEKLNFNV
jgi:hypothetical protein